MKDQSEKKRAKDLLEERKREMLRTGHDPGAVVVPSGMANEEDQRRAEIAQRREAQLAELRRRAQMRQQGQTPPTGGGGPALPPRRVTTPPKAVPKARPEVKTQGALQRGKDLSPQRSTVPRQAKQPAMRAVVMEADPVTHRLVPEQQEVTRRVMSPVVSGVPETAEEWRRAIIANEILSPPVTMREGRAELPF